MTPDNKTSSCDHGRLESDEVAAGRKRRDEMAQEYQDKHYCFHCKESFKAGYDAGREDASPRYMLGETTQPRVPNKTEHYIGVTPPGEIEGLRPKDPQPTERREFWITDNTDNSGLTVDTEFNHSRHFGSCNVIHVREIGNGLIPVEDVRPLLDAINSFNKAKWVFDDNWRKTEDAQKLYRAFNEFLAKHPGLK